jgi:hypothetical protein
VQLVGIPAGRVPLKVTVPPGDMLYDESLIAIVKTHVSEVPIEPIVGEQTIEVMEVRV